MTQVITRHTSAPAPDLVVEKLEAITPSSVVEKLELAIKSMTDLVNGGQQLSELQQASLLALDSLRHDYELSSKLGLKVSGGTKPILARTVLFDKKIGFMLGECNSVELYLGGDCAFYEHRRKDVNGRFEQIDVNHKPASWRNYILGTLRCMRHLGDPKRNTFGF